MPKITIDGREIEVAAGTSVLQACEQAGIEIPRFCYHDHLSVAGNCRMCMVEVEKVPKPVASCTWPCSEGMVVKTTSEVARNARKAVMEFLLINHPLDCPICDQGGECDLQDLALGYGREQSRYGEPKRAVSDKNLGPLVKTVMTRCIQCTRCIRFADEIAGTPELGGLFRGEHLEIDTGTDLPLRSELSGNLVDVCPVGALTNKPFAFRARSWELQATASIDVMDAVGSHIQIEAKGDEVFRILPRRNADINAVWINDKTRHACDGLKYQRLDRPYVRGKNGKLREAEWSEAVAVIAERLRTTAPERTAALAGDLSDCESMFALLQLMKMHGSPNTDCRQDGAEYDVSARSNYIMNSSIAGIDKADAVLLIGTNPRHEGTMVNARLRKRWLEMHKQGVDLPIALLGEASDLSYPYHYIGDAPASSRELISGRSNFAALLKAAHNPMMIVGAGALARSDGAVIHAMARELANKCNLIRPDWNGFNVLQNAAARVGGLDIGFLPDSHGGKVTRAIVTSGDIDFLYLLGADEVNFENISRQAFVVYQGHHGDRGAARADVILPAPAYTEKSGTYVNTEGRPQMSARAVAPVGKAKEDWEIINMIGAAAGYALPFADLTQLRACMTAAHPHLADLGHIRQEPWSPVVNATGELLPVPFSPTIPNFYMTCPISRASPTMAKCTEEILPLLVA